MSFIADSLGVLKIEKEGQLSLFSGVWEEGLGKYGSGGDKKNGCRKME